MGINQMTQTTTNNPCQKSLEESFGAVVEGWVDGCPSLLIEGTSKEIGIVLDIDGSSQQHPHSHARIMIHSKDDLQVLQETGEWQKLISLLTSHEYETLYLVDMTKTGQITDGKSVADFMEKI